VLWSAAGAMGGAETVWFRGGHGRGPVVFLHAIHVSRPVPGQGGQGIDKGEAGECSRHGYRTWGEREQRCLQWVWFCKNSAQKVFDTMSARIQTLNF
jgi:hypothetical protein